jgi:hypothetical protein
MITLAQFLNIFSSSYISFSDFIDNTRVRVGTNLHPLKLYIQQKSIPMEDLRVLYENINNKTDYLTRFYNVSLKINTETVHFHGKLQPMKNGQFNNNQQVGIKNPIRNLHFRDILQNTKSGMENNPTFLKVIIDLYNHKIIDYKILTPSAIFYMKNGRIGSVFSSFYFRASILNPYLVYSLNESLLRGKRIFTPTLGWSSYCYGFLESPQVTEYVGTDVIPQVCDKTREFAKSFSPSKRCEIFCEPSEDLMNNLSFRKKYREHFDVVFFSPPYYRLEMYQGKMQSTQRYDSYDEWLAKYWEKTIQLCHQVLVKGGLLCYILSDYGSEKTKIKYDLVDDMNKITKKYFRQKSIQPMFNKDVHVTKHKETNEQIMLFSKKTT